MLDKYKNLIRGDKRKGTFIYPFSGKDEAENFYNQFTVLTLFSGHSDQPFSLQHARGGNYFHSQNPLGLYLLLIDCTFSKVGLC